MKNSVKFDRADTERPHKVPAGTRRLELASHKETMGAVASCVAS